MQHFSLAIPLNEWYNIGRRKIIREFERRPENMDTREQLKKMRAETGMSQVKFAEYMGIPRRTIEEWERGSRKPPEYVVRLIAYKLHVEGLISSDL